MMLLTNAAPIINSFTLFAVGEREATPFEEEPLSSQSKIELINRLKAGMGDKREEVRLRSLSDLLEFDFTARDRFRYILR